MPALPPPYAPVVHPHALTVGEEFAFDRATAEALVFRTINAKEAFTLADAHGDYFRASVLELTATGGRATVYEKLAASPESNASITLVCAVLARQRMLWVAQKATELGVVRIAPVFSERSVDASGLGHEKVHAWPGQTKKGARQCRRASVPELRRAVPIEALVGDSVWRDAHARFYLDDRAAKRTGAITVPSAVEGVRAPVDVAYAVGPEGGWTDSERRLFEDTGATAMRFGGRVLRAETAVLVGLTMLQASLGDMGG